MSVGGVRRSVRSALQSTRLLGKGAGRLAADAVVGAVQAAAEVSAETGALVRDAVVGVVEGTADVVKATPTMMHDIAGGAVHARWESGMDAAMASRDAVEGAIRGAASVGVSLEEAAEEATKGAFKAVQERDGDLGDAAEGAMRGVVIGLEASGGDVIGASKATAMRMVRAVTGDQEDTVEVVEGAVEGVLDSATHANEVEDTVLSVVTGSLEAAYQSGRVTGEAARDVAIAAIRKRRLRLTPVVEKRLIEDIHELSQQISSHRASWRGRAIWRAGRSLVDVGGIDLAASLAYFTLLSFFPLIALVVLVFSIFVEPDTLRERLSELLAYYFPSSDEFLIFAIDHLFRERLFAGLIALGGMVLGANGLFMAANRGINRIYGTPIRRMLRATVMEAGLVSMLVILFILSTGLTMVFQVTINVSEALPVISNPISAVTLFAIEVVSTALPFILTGGIFMVVFLILPNQTVGWRDATFGALVAVLLFEFTKILFFYFSNLASQRNLLYGPMASVIILLIWSHLAGLIFLYGASLTKQSMMLRPRPDSLKSDPAGVPKS